jgi:hypothetical protein
VARRSVLEGTHSFDNRSSAEWLLRNHAPDDRLGVGPSLIVILLLSLGLWAAIWEAVASLISAEL